MLFCLIVISIYLSFGVDLCISPIPSEASTLTILSKQKCRITIKSIQFILFSMLNLIFYSFPLYLTIKQLILGGGLLLNNIVVITGLVISILGRLISLKSSQVLRRYHDKYMVSDSIFRWSRNPITFGIHLTIFGLCLSYNLWFLWIGFIFFVYNLDIKIKIEEDYLLTKHNEKYLNYMKKTRRYI